jgi:hypothetical protein
VSLAQLWLSAGGNFRSTKFGAAGESLVAVVILR